jgi:hypothetical protein
VWGPGVFMHCVRNIGGFWQCRLVGGWQESVSLKSTP